MPKWPPVRHHPAANCRHPGHWPRDSTLRAPQADGARGAGGRRIPAAVLVRDAMKKKTFTKNNSLPQCGKRGKRRESPVPRQHSWGRRRAPRRRRWNSTPPKPPTPPPPPWKAAAAAAEGPPRRPSVEPERAAAVPRSPRSADPRQERSHDAGRTRGAGLTRSSSLVGQRK